MRPIKFRAWNKKTNQMIDQINEIEFDNSCCESIPHTVSFDFFNGNFDTEVWHKDDFILLQLTGLQDKDGVDIYEGDILGETRLLHDGPCYCTVEVKYVAPSFKVRDLALSSYMGIEWEVIGNKFESPELLEK